MFIILNTQYFNLSIALAPVLFEMSLCCGSRKSLPCLLISKKRFYWNDNFIFEEQSDIMAPKGNANGLGIVSRRLISTPNFY